MATQGAVTGPLKVSVDLHWATEADTSLPLSWITRRKACEATSWVLHVLQFVLMRAESAVDVYH